MKVENNTTEKTTKTTRESFEIGSSLVRAAQLCQGHDDIREYLNGIRLSADGLIQGTNGHVIFTANGHFKTEKNTIVKIEGILPKKGTATFDWVDDTQGLIRVRKAGSYKDKYFHFQVVEGAWVNDKKAIPTGDHISNDGFSIAGNYLRLAGKIFGRYCPVISRVFSEELAIPVLLHPITAANAKMPEGSEPRLYIMQMRTRE